MTSESRIELRQNADAFGAETQIMQTMEEMAELIQALSKYNRYVIHAKNEAERAADIHKAMDDICEEVADVELMLWQMKYLLKIPDSTIEGIKELKIKRMTERRMQGGRHD